MLCRVGALKGRGASSSFNPLTYTPFQWMDGADRSTLWQDTGATTAVTAVSDQVALWQDKSGNARHASIATSSKRPLYTASGLSHDGIDDALSTAAVTLANTGCSIYIVASLASASSYPALLCYGETVSGALNVRTVAATGRPSFISATTNTGAGASALATAAGTTSDMTGAGLQTLSMTLSAADVFTLWQNKTQRDQRTVTFTMAAAQPLYIGHRNGAIFWPGNIAEILLFNTEHDTTTRQAFENYLSAKWGTP